ncbi:MAG TPA: hypothetical protein PLQ56_05855 [Aggregatilineales bacterium]|nr:hypothetical protein [Aggregatilineales bacterium]
MNNSANWQLRARSQDRDLLVVVGLAVLGLIVALVIGGVMSRRQHEQTTSAQKVRKMMDKKLNRAYDAGRDLLENLKQDFERRLEDASR